LQLIIDDPNGKHHSGAGDAQYGSYNPGGYVKPPDPPKPPDTPTSVSDPIDPTNLTKAQQLALEAEKQQYKNELTKWIAEQVAPHENWEKALTEMYAANKITDENMKIDVTTLWAVAITSLLTIGFTIAEVMQTLQMLNGAVSHLGKPYNREAGKRKGPDSFDCSGFVWYIMSSKGPYDFSSKTSGELWTAMNNKNDTQFQAVQQGRPGDLVIFTGTGGKPMTQVSHVGIYLGSGLMIHTIGSRGGVCVSRLAETYWAVRIKDEFGRVSLP